MKAKGLVWLGTRTRSFDDTVRFFADTLGLHAVHEADDGGSWSHFRGSDGNVYEITTPAKPET